MEGNSKFVTSLFFFFVTVCHFGHAIYLQGKENSFAKYPIWDACINASMSFDFKTTKDNDSLLMYLDDQGLVDFAQVELKREGVTLMIKVSSDPDIAKQVIVPGRYSDNLWHTVTITRNRMEVILTVDGRSYREFLEGTDFYLGNVSRNSYLYFGGIPKIFWNDLSKLSNPGIMLANNFHGYIRNVIYRNCSCVPVRAEMIDGYGVQEEEEKEKCKSSNKCEEGCVCISTDTDTGCDCSYREQCATKGKWKKKKKKEFLVLSRYRGPYLLSCKQNIDPVICGSCYWTVSKQNWPKH